ncbi:NACHT domain-containing protein [Algoriphagus halophytocola]|uniref:NACHT domain-containing protein n=1 Tax=Algoriphagus halophytocola TaxID=2991499 RepID=UPI0022DE945C|nr:NACHT domain-containing protein [Algoriphagus sp. TR-M9]WBL43545.1 NACHT domain-containing protein [Algoriphagus sp. TR-M9]
MLKEIVLKETGSLVFKLIANQLKKLDFKTESSETDIVEALSQHITYVKNWSSEINFKDLQKSKKTYSVYIPLNLYISPVKLRLEEGDKLTQAPILDVFKVTENHVAILGQPGAGKTTSMKFICQSVFFDSDFYADQFSLPILIRLREFNISINENYSAGIVYEYLFNLFGVKISKIDQEDNLKDINRIKEKIVIEILNNNNFIIIIDGFDELSTKKNRGIVLGELSSLANYVESSKIVITSRTADFNYTSENLSTFEICSLNKEQILDFSTKWLGDSQKGNEFVNAVERSPFNDTTIRPLTIAHLCAIYEKNNKIPDKPKTVYKKIIYLLLEEWDEQRNLQRLSKYGNFEVDRKFEFLSALAFHLTVSTNKSYFSVSDLGNAYGNIFGDFDMSSKDMKSVINEIESHSGLFIQSGYESYEFAHKSLQEYLTAEYIVKMPFIPNRRNLTERLPNEFAIAIAISSMPSDYFISFVLNNLNEVKDIIRFIQIFINRLILEKPDFNKNNSVSLVSLMLYSTYLEVYIKDSEQLSLFIMDNLANEFEIFIKSIIKRNTFELILENYEEISSLPSSDGNIIFTYNLMNIGVSIGNIQLPFVLRCRKTFLEF